MLNVAPYLNRVAKGKHGSQRLSRAEASDVFHTLLQPEADPLQLGAFLIAQRMKGETAEELAGFIDASRQHCSGFDHLRAPKGTVDLPCYAGKRRAPHAHLAAALRMREENIPVFVHGVEHIEGRISAWQILQTYGVKRAKTLDEAQSILQSEALIYMDLAEICPNLQRIYQLRARLGVRSFSHTVARLLNPLQCQGQLNGMFHTPYADHMAQANGLLQQPRSLIFMGAEGEPELYSDRQKVVKMQVGERISDLTFEDLGYLPYPKHPVEPLERLFDDFETMQQAIEPQSEATIHRMQQAFRWASGQPLKEAPYA